MLKIILGMLVLMLTSNVIAATTQSQPQQLYIIGFDDSGTDKPLLTVQWQMSPDSEAHADTPLPCTRSTCRYGLYLHYCPPNSNCPPRPMRVTSSPLSSDPNLNGGTVMSVDVGALSGIKTYREANDKFMKEIGTSGMGYVHFKYRPKQWEYCFGSFLETANGTDESHPVGCFNIPMVPIQCEVSSNGLDLQHGVFNSAQLNAANTTKSATGSFTVNCTRDASLMFELTEEQITLTDGLTANLRMTTNGQTIPNKSSLSINGNTVTTFDITSTLNATGKIPPNSYSANAILIITAE